MLLPAYVMKEELQAAAKAAIVADPARFKWYRMTPNSPWLPDPTNDDWNHVARVSVGGDGAILGHMSARVDRGSLAVDEVSSVSFKPGSITFLRDLQRFMSELQGGFRVIRFTVAVDNKIAERAWRRWCEANGGHEVGVLYAYGRAMDGTILDVHLFQIRGAGL